MKKYNVVVQQLAKTDIREARQWYNSQKSGLGKRLNADMTATLRKIERNPTSFAIRYKQVRLANFSTFPYAAHFYIDTDNTTVYDFAFMHTSAHSDTPKNR